LSLSFSEIHGGHEPRLRDRPERKRLHALRGLDEDVIALGAAQYPFDASRAVDRRA